MAGDQDHQMASPCGSLVVRPSVFPEAGLGLFVTRRFAAGEQLPCEYTGDWLTFAQLNRLPHTARGYIMGLHFNTHVDAGE